MASQFSPWWHRILTKYCPILFRRCPGWNFHWRWDNVCHCIAGENGHGTLRRLIGNCWADRKTMQIFEVTKSEVNNYQVPW